MKHVTRISILSTLIIVLTLSAFTTQPAQAATQFRLPANAGWVDSGFAIQAGQQVTITAYGQVVTAPINVFDSGSVSGPDGQVSICPNYDGAPPCAMDGAPYGALLGKIGVNGTPFLIGSNYTFTAESSGELYLAVNDLLPYYQDNYGNYMVFFNR